MDDVGIQFLLDANGQDLAIRHTQDVEPILELNRLKRGETQHSDWGREIADIPNVIYMKWLQEEHDRGNVSLRPFTPEFDAIVKRKLYDPDWAYLRTDSAHVQGFLGFGS